MREAVLADLVFEELLFCAKFFGFIDKGEEGELRVLESLFHVIGPWEVILPVLLVGGIQNEEVNVGVFHAFFDTFHHAFLEFIGGFDDARGVGENELVVVVVKKAQDSVAGCLRFVCSDGEFLAKEGVEQG